MLTYKDLLMWLNEMSHEQLNETATVYIEGQDEFFGVDAVDRATADCGVLDEGHFYLVIDTEQT